MQLVGTSESTIGTVLHLSKNVQNNNSSTQRVAARRSDTQERWRRCEASCRGVPSALTVIVVREGVTRATTCVTNENVDSAMKI